MTKYFLVLLAAAGCGTVASGSDDVPTITSISPTRGGTPGGITVTVTGEDGSESSFEAVVRIDTPGEADYYRNGGILQYVLRSLV